MCYHTAAIHCSVMICMSYLPKQQAMIGCHIKLVLVCKDREEDLVTFYLILLILYPCHFYPVVYLWWLAQDENRTSNELEWMGQPFTIHHFTYEKGNENYIIWGLTAGILIHAASVVYQRQPDFPEKRAQFNLPKYSNECYSMPSSGLWNANLYSCVSTISDWII